MSVAQLKLMLKERGILSYQYKSLRTKKDLLNFIKVNDLHKDEEEYLTEEENYDLELSDSEPSYYY
jgi:hypothetical protein